MTLELDPRSEQEIRQALDRQVDADRWTLLDRALARLSPLDQSLIRQFVAGESYDQIAAKAGLSLGAVKARLHRVRPFLRNWVGAMTETRLPGERRRRAA